MYTKWIAILAAVLSLGMLATEADAKRLGGGSSVGKQRSATPPAASPSAQPNAPAATPAAPAPQPSGMSRWLGPLAGLAIGAGLASMFMGNGFGGAFGSILLMLAIAAAVIFALRMLRSKPQQSSLEYAGNAAPRAPGAQNNLSTAFGGGAPRVEPTNRFPPGFDAAQFAHHAKLNFTKLQAANDQGDLSTMREFMTPELYAQIAADLQARGTTAQKTDVVTLNADVIEVVTEGDAYVASVNFNGMIREETNAAATAFSEIWHLEKPVNGNTGWLISGIQQN
ncbi:MAG TPA: TIM44-like domain-containing protein [Burkholderiales bacterium]|nr:TIM44-like domain-containing protein [Burkholderiales bacterium]